MTPDPRLRRTVAAQPYPALFATVSGAHLYGLPSPDSDFDLCGAHLLPLENVLGLDVRGETVQDSRVIHGSACDASARPELPSEETRRALNSLLTRVRMKRLAGQP